MAVVKKTVGTTAASPKKTKVDTAKVAATKITTAKIHTTSQIPT
jgi:hypothetical protein